MKILSSLLVLALIGPFSLMTKETDSTPINILAFSKTDGYRHDSIPAAIKAFSEMAQEHHWSVTFTEDAEFFNKAILDRMDVVVFLLTSENVFNDEQKVAFKAFMQGGGGFFGVHSGGTNTEYEWKWYAEMIGAHFSGHPPVCDATLIIEDSNHAATRCFEEKHVLWQDEIYSFDRNPRGEVDVLISVDETSYDTTNNPWFGGDDLAMGDHPLVWCRLYEGGRVIQTALGHTIEKYSEPVFRKHLAGAVHWAAGLE